MSWFSTSLVDDVRFWLLTLPCLVWNFERETSALKPKSLPFCHSAYHTNVAESPDFPL
ncbi:hypothetical protein SK128_003950, partial [Halocaridina rubra]